MIRVELKNILPPREIQDAMEKQMKAERERRARILDAEGEKRSQILVAEGLKESAILKADAVKEQKIREAQGEAEAILTVQKANADALRMLNEAAPNDRVIQLKSLEAFGKAADGKATGSLEGRKIIEKIRHPRHQQRGGDCVCGGNGSNFQDNSFRILKPKAFFCIIYELNYILKR